MYKILLPVSDFAFDKVQAVCADFKCQLKYANRSRTYFEISSDDPVNFFWLGINFNHKMGLDDVAAEMKKAKPWLYK